MTCECHAGGQTLGFPAALFLFAGWLTCWTGQTLPRWVRLLCTALLVLAELAPLLPLMQLWSAYGMWMPKISKVDAWMIACIGSTVSASRRLCEDFFVPIIKSDVFDICTLKQACEPCTEMVNWICFTCSMLLLRAYWLLHCLAQSSFLFWLSALLPMKVQCCQGHMPQLPHRSYPALPVSAPT